jgi:hypothetical protein
MSAMSRSADLQFGQLTGGQRPISDIHYPEFIASKQSLACVRIFSITGCSRIAAMIFS